MSVDPIGRYLALGGLEIQFWPAHTSLLDPRYEPAYLKSAYLKQPQPSCAARAAGENPAVIRADRRWSMFL